MQQLQLVRDEHYGAPLADEPRHARPQPPPHLRVDRGEDVVEEERLGLGVHGTREGDTRALPARQRMAALAHVRLVAARHRTQVWLECRHRQRALIPRRLEGLAEEDVPPHALPHQKRLLRHVRTAPRRCARACRQRARPRERGEQRRLTATHGAAEDEQLRRLDLQLNLAISQLDLVVSRPAVAREEAKSRAVAAAAVAAVAIGGAAADRGHEARTTQRHHDAARQVVRQQRCQRRLFLVLRGGGGHGGGVDRWRCGAPPLPPMPPLLSVLSVLSVPARGGRGRARCVAVDVDVDHSTEAAQARCKEGPCVDKARQRVDGPLKLLDPCQRDEGGGRVEVLVLH